MTKTETKTIDESKETIETLKKELDELKTKTAALEKPAVVKRVRPRERNLSEEASPLAFLDGVKIPGYVTRLVLEVKGKDLFHLHKMQQIGYEFVHPKEINLTSIGGEPVVGDKVVITGKGSEKVYLMKIPEEWYEDDKRKKAERNNKGLFNDVRDDSSSVTRDATSILDSKLNVSILPNA